MIRGTATTEQASQHCVHFEFFMPACNERVEQDLEFLKKVIRTEEKNIS